MTTQNKHTPGPWCIVDSAEVWAGNQPICIIAHEENSNLDARTASANQSLIAAAPELLDALRRLLSEADELFQLSEEHIVNNGDNWVCKSCNMELDSGGGRHAANCCASRILDLAATLHAASAAIAKVESL